MPAHNIFFFGLIALLAGLLAGTTIGFTGAIIGAGAALILFCIWLQQSDSVNPLFLASVFCLVFAVASFYAPYRVAMRETRASAAISSVPAFSFLSHLKDYTLSVFDRTLRGDQGALMSGLLIGERKKFSPTMIDAMRISGTTHIVALSGYNIMIVSSFALSFFGFFLTRRFAFLTATAAIILFVIMTGAAPSLVRAAILGIVVLLAFQTERPYHPRNAIALTAALMAIHDPRILGFDIGFQLSFAALLGIVYVRPLLGPLIQEKSARSARLPDGQGSASGGKLLRWIRDQFLTTLAAQLAVLPLLLFHFGQFSLFSVFANLLILWTLPLLMLLGFVIIITAAALPFFAHLIAGFTSLLLAYVVGVISWFGSLSFSSFTVRGFEFPASILYSLLLALFLASLYKKKARHEIVFQEDEGLA